MEQLSEWWLTDSDFCMGISALVRRMECIRRGIPESLHIMERWKRLRAVGHPSLQFMTIAWSITTSGAIWRADTSRGIQKHPLINLMHILNEMPLGFPLVIDLTTSIPHAEFQHHMREEGHECRQHAYEHEMVQKWMYIKSLVTPNHGFDATLFKRSFCELNCTWESFEARFR